MVKLKLRKFTSKKINRYQERGSVQKEEVQSIVKSPLSFTTPLRMKKKRSSEWNPPMSLRCFIIPIQDLT